MPGWSTELTLIGVGRAARGGTQKAPSAACDPELGRTSWRRHWFTETSRRREKTLKVQRMEARVTGLNDRCLK